MEKKNRVRGENWMQDEKDMFIEIMRQSASIIENKQTDTNTNKKKSLEWVKIQAKFREMTGTHRGISQLKGLWRRTKRAAKKTVSEHKRAVRANGGGPQPPSPSPNDKIIVDLCLTDFIFEENQSMNDSDSVSSFIGQGATEKVDDEILSDNEVNEDIDNEHASFEEIVAFHNNEGNIKSVEGTKFNPKPTHSKIKISKTTDASKAAFVETNTVMMQPAMALMEQEYMLKIKFQNNEISHQEIRHKREIEILLLEKERKQQELELVLLEKERKQKELELLSIEKEKKQWEMEILKKK